MVGRIKRWQIGKRGKLEYISVIFKLNNCIALKCRSRVTEDL